MTARKTNLIKQRVDHIAEELDRCRIEYQRVSDFLAQELKKGVRMQDMLEELLDYFQEEYDTVDDDNCQPMPNRAMKWGQAIEEALGRGGRYG